MRKCLRCEAAMVEGCEANINGSLMYVNRIAKRETLFRHHVSDCHAAVCPKCGYVELYVVAPYVFEDVETGEDDR